MQKSKLFSLGMNDFVKGLITAIITAILTVVYQIVQNEGLNFGKDDWKLIVSTAILAGLSYIMKNFLTNSDGVIIKKESKNESSTI